MLTFTQLYNTLVSRDKSNNLLALSFNTKLKYHTLAVHPFTHINHHITYYLFEVGLFLHTYSSSLFHCFCYFCRSHFVRGL